MINSLSPSISGLNVNAYVMRVARGNQVTEACESDHGIDTQSPTGGVSAQGNGTQMEDYWTTERMLEAGATAVEVPYPETPAETATAAQEASDEPIDESGSMPLGPIGGFSPILGYQKYSPKLDKEEIDTKYWGGIPGTGRWNTSYPPPFQRSALFSGYTKLPVSTIGKIVPELWV